MQEEDIEEGVLEWLKNEDRILLQRLCEIENVDFNEKTGTGYYETMHVPCPYQPLSNDKQAMELVKKYKLAIVWDDSKEDWEVGSSSNFRPGAVSKDLNRAICMAIIKEYAPTHDDNLDALKYTIVGATGDKVTTDEDIRND